MITHFLIYVTKSVSRQFNGTLFHRQLNFYSYLLLTPKLFLYVHRTEIFSGKTVTHDDISYEQACILYNLGELYC